MDYIEALQKQDILENHNSDNNEPIKQEFMSLGIKNDDIILSLQQLIDKEFLNINNIDEQTVELLNKLPQNSSFFDDINQLDSTNFSDNFKNLLKQKINELNSTKQATTNQKNKSNKPGPDEEKLNEIINRTGYQIEVTVGQRKYGGPPPNWEGTTPGNGCEVFIGKLPKDCFEDLLVPIFEQYGKIWDLRVMIDSSTGYTKGYAFVTYCDKENARQAANKLNGYELKPNKRIQVNVSIPNVRLFIGNIPKTKSKEEIKDEFSKIIDGIKEVIIYNPVEENNEKLKNRGFCFIDFESHKAASVARRKLQTTRIRVFNRDIGVEWADPDDEPDEETMSKVKVLYVKNLSPEITENEIKDKFSAFGPVEQVRRVKDYAFVTFIERDDAVKAMETLQGQAYGKHNLEISLAKPLTDKKKQMHREREERKRMEIMMKNGSTSANNGSSAASSENGYAPIIPQRDNGKIGRGSFNQRNNFQNNNHFNNNEFDENMFFHMMREMGFHNFDEAMHFFATNGAGNMNMNANNFDYTNMHRNYNSNRNNFNGRNGQPNNNRTHSGYSNRQMNLTPNQFSPGYSNKRKADNSNVNINKKGRFQNNTSNNNGSQNVNAQQFSATNQQIPQQSLMTDFSQDFYTAQWN